MFHCYHLIPNNNIDSRKYHQKIDTHTTDRECERESEGERAKERELKAAHIVSITHLEFKIDFIKANRVRNVNINKYPFVC